MAGLIIAMVIAIPVILFPVALIWYINAGGLYQLVKEAREARKKALGTVNVAG
jgi:hypothetical protein